MLDALFLLPKIQLIFSLFAVFLQKLKKYKQERKCNAEITQIY